MASKPIPIKKTLRVSTGIPGFDELVQGGFPKNSSILICGSPGVGKSIFALEYLVKGAEVFGEKGLYVTFEQKPEALKGQAIQFGWDLNVLEQKGLLNIMSFSVDKINLDLIKNIRDFVVKNKIQRLVIDSLSTLIVNAPIYMSSSDISVKEVIGENVFLSPPIVGDYLVRKFIYKFIESLGELNCTSILTSEAPESGDYLTRDTLSEFACDGVVFISLESLGGQYSRNLIVKKMRQTKNDEDIHPLEINDKGMIIHRIE